MANIYSISLGCPKNRVDTEKLLGAVPGVKVVSTLNDACCILINTCAFIEPAVSESVSVIAEAIEDIKEQCRDGTLLVVAGCLVGRYGAELLAPEFPEVDLWLDNRKLGEWGENLRTLLMEKGYCHNQPINPVFRRLLSTGPSYAWLKISEGCNHACSFCSIPTIRGRLRSDPAESLLAESRELLASGVKELILVAQDTTAWGSDWKRQPNKREGLAELLARLLPLPGLERLRLMYLYPAGLTADLLSFLRGVGSPFVPYFDIPLQHAHSGILSRMGRPFARDPRIVLDRVRSFFPEAALRTSIIVGFPGETDADFQTVYDFIAETRFHHLGVFSYQAEEGTGAAKNAESSSY